MAAAIPTEINIFKLLIAEITEVNELRNYYAHKVLKTGKEKPAIKLIRNFVFKFDGNRELRDVSDETALAIFTKIFSEFVTRSEIIRTELRIREQQYNVEIKEILESLFPDQDEKVIKE